MNNKSKLHILGVPTNKLGQLANHNEIRTLTIEACIEKNGV